jgi:hypothetical protein
MVPAFLMSLLSRQLVLLGEEAFLSTHAHAWLVWEPGTWQSPSSPAESDTGETVLPTRRGPAHPGVDDPLCFELITRADAETWLKVGRAPDSAIVLNDMTVSRDQLRLVGTPDGWTSHDAPGGTAAPLPLGNETTLRAGGVTLSFYQPAAFLERLRRERAERGQ